VLKVSYVLRKEIAPRHSSKVPLRREKERTKLRKGDPSAGEEKKSESDPIFLRDPSGRVHGFPPVHRRGREGRGSGGKGNTAEIQF